MSFLPQGYKRPVDKKLIHDIVELALAYGWESRGHNPDNSMLSFFKEDMRINVYYTTMTVGTCLDHPRQGRTQLFRRNLTLEDVERIFHNPRAHTNKGYHKRPKSL